MNKLAFMYITLMPTIVAGICTMIWMKLPILSILKRPIDNGKELKDGRRIFGDNKTWKGFVGYIITNIVIAILWGLLSSQVSYLESHNYFYMNYNNTIIYNFGIGILLGLAYSLFELPNSFMKRRIGIVPGMTLEGAQKMIFVFIDQADSIFGCGLVVWLFYNIGLSTYIAFILVGAITHIVINILLYFAHLRKNMF